MKKHGGEGVAWAEVWLAIVLRPQALQLLVIARNTCPKSEDANVIHPHQLSSLNNRRLHRHILLPILTLLIANIVLSVQLARNRTMP